MLIKSLEFESDMEQCVRAGYCCTLLGLLAVIIHTHCELLSYWMGKLGDVNVPEGPKRFIPHVFAANKTEIQSSSHL